MSAIRDLIWDAIRQADMFCSPSVSPQTYMASH